MFLFSYMLKKAGSDVWYRICGIFMAVKAIALLLAPSLPVYYLVQVLQLAGWGLIAIAPIYYVNRVIGSEDAIKGQAYIGMSYTVASVLASMVGGRLADRSGRSSCPIDDGVTCWGSGSGGGYCVYRESGAKRKIEVAEIAGWAIVMGCPSKCKSVFSVECQFLVKKFFCAISAERSHKKLLY